MLRERRNEEADGRSDSSAMPTQAGPVPLETAGNPRAAAPQRVAS